MTTMFGYRPQLSKGPPPPSVVPRERVYGNPVSPLPSVNIEAIRREAAASAWAEGFRAAELIHGTKVVYLNDDEPVRPSLGQIIREVAAKYEFSVDELKSDRRNRAVVIARHEAMWRCKNETLNSLTRIAQFFGGKDHTTVMNALKRHEERMATGRGG